MDVRIVGYTPYAPVLADTAALLTRSIDHPYQIFTERFAQDEEEGNGGRVAINVFGYGHESVYEHATVTYAINDVSRVFETDLVRHRIASYSIRAGRKTGTYLNVVIPPTVQQCMNDDPVFQDKVQNVLVALEEYKAYCELLNIPTVETRYLFPQGNKTGILMTMNLRELCHFFNLRLCKKAQWESRGVAWRMYGLLEYTPLWDMAKNGLPPCVYGKCPQGKESCGEPYTEEEVHEILDQQFQLGLVKSIHVFE